MGWVSIDDDALSFFYSTMELRFSRPEKSMCHVTHRFFLIRKRSSEKRLFHSFVDSTENEIQHIILILFDFFFNRFQFIYQRFTLIHNMSDTI